MTKKVLFVCMGNICRSPAGAAVMQRFAEEFRVDVDIDSAGTHGYHVGETVDARMLAAAEDLDPDQFDLVLAMDTENHTILLEMAGGIKTHIRMFSDYLDDDDWPTDVPDPYYGEEDGFDEVLDMLEEGCPVILQTLMGEGIFDGMFEE